MIKTSMRAGCGSSRQILLTDKILISMNTNNLSKYIIGLGTVACTSTIWPLLCSAQDQNTSGNNSKKPNVLFIAIDDLRPVISVYGDNMARTPNFKRLAKYGVTFTNNYCQFALSGPTRASLLTGVRPDNTGVWSLQGNFRTNNPSLVTLPELFKKNGYETVGMGKIYHPLDDRNYRDDPQSWSIPYIKTPAPTYVISNGRKATECADVPDNAYEDGIIAEKGVEMIKSFAETGKSFFLAIGFKKPHAPYVAPKKYWDMYDRDKMPLAEYQDVTSDPVVYAYHPSNELKVYSDIPPFHSYEDTKHLDVATQRRVIHAYYACVSYVDAQLGKLLDALEEKGMAENTIIVLWSDHGYHLGDHGLWNKNSNFETATRTVMLISAPGMKRGAYTSNVTEFVDIFPTLCELTGVKAPTYLDGHSLVPVLQEPSKKVAGYAFGQYNRGQVNGYSIRSSRYRMVEWVKDFRTYLPFDGKEIMGVELYDYENDPLETRNEAGNPLYKKVLEKLQKELHLFYKMQYKKSRIFNTYKLFPVEENSLEGYDNFS